MPRPCHQAKPVPYDEIDVEIRRLVSIINKYPGIRTISSCAGHQQSLQSTVGFRAADQEALGRLVAALPFTGSQGQFLDRPILQSIYVTVDNDHGAPTYVLRISGSPYYIQRELLASVEEALSSGPERPASHPSSPNDGWNGNMGTSPVD